MNQIKLTGVWGTQVELQATSDLVGIPVYVALFNTKGLYCWSLFKPRRMDIEDTINGLSQPTSPFTVKHIEIAQNNMHNHYDSIVPMFTGGHALHPPTIETRTIDTIQVD